MISRSLKLSAGFCLALLSTMTFANTDFLVVTDPHLNISVKKTSMYSLTHDTGMDLWQASLDAIKSTVKQRPVSFALLLGDLPAHHMGDPLKSNSELLVLQDLRKALGRTPIIYISGNNDPLGGNYHSYTSINSDSIHRPDELDTQGAWPAHGVKQCNAVVKACVVNNGPANSSAYFYGSYSTYPLKDHRLRVIALNTVPFVDSANASYQSDDGVTQADTIATLSKWLDSELESASKNNEKVIIAMHIPPGLDAYKHRAMWDNTASQAFASSVKKYQSNIIGVFAGHTHYDAIRFMRNGANDPSTLVFLSPGIDTGHTNNPGFKIFNLDNDWNVSNATSYAGDGNLQFQEQYDYKSAYLSHCPSKYSLHACLDKLDADNQFYPLMQPHYALGNSDFNQWSGVEDAVHVPSIQ